MLEGSGGGFATDQKSVTKTSLSVSTLPKEILPKMAVPTPTKAILSPAEPVSLDDQIQRRAYERYIKRGGAQSESGSELDDWLQAEKEILAAQEQPDT